MYANVECEPCQSGSAMARDFCLSRTDVLEVLNKVHELKNYSLCWVLHTLNEDQEAAGVETVASMLSILEPLTAHARSWGLNGDESWFDFSYDAEGKWALARDPQ
jgi:hypothetical protein